MSLASEPPIAIGALSLSYQRQHMAPTGTKRIIENHLCFFLSDDFSTLMNEGLGKSLVF
jgi:hypothetical protein